MSVTGIHSFDNALDLQPIDATRMRGRTQPDWANMVGPFGGITAATLLHAVELRPDRIGEPLALTVNFAAPITDGEFDISLKPARTNRTNQHWIAELSQDGDVKTTATMVFGIRRDTWSDDETQMPDVPQPEGLSVSGPPLVWVKQYDTRYVENPFPTEGSAPSPSSRTTLWVRDAGQRGLDFAALAAMSDIFYPRVFLRRGEFTPAGTISLTTYFHANGQELEKLGGDFVLGSAHANRFADGYFDQSAHVWSRDGALLTSTHQIVYFKG
ncbi:acyl-CoA thioesterase [Mycobacterium sp. CBMA 234]|nr:acyl-CoA thioesterase [Mycolicibacterium sp. CBMA 234]